jgi:hypothetical protein
VIDAIDPPERLLELELALPPEHAERRALSAWLHPHQRRDAGDLRLRRHLEADLVQLASLMRDASPSTALG